MHLMRLRNFKGLSFSLMLGITLVAGNANAAPTAVELGDFSGNETVIDFNTIGDEELITDQFADICVGFSGAIYGMTNSGDTAQFPDNGGGVIASNWLYSGGGLQGTSFTVDLGSRQSRVGFYVETNEADDTTIEVTVNGGVSGSVFFDTNIDGSQFIGVEDPEGIDSITVTVEDDDNGFLAIDDLRFEGGSICGAEALPVPALSNSSLLILFISLLGFGMVASRTRVW